MSRVEFRLSMPSRGSWNGEWSGAARNYVIVRSLPDIRVSELIGTELSRSWLHRWDDGWCAQITARVMARGERTPKSDGFSGYDWMVANILAHGSPYDRAALREGEKA
jgi:hypothetical protein